MNFLIRAPWLYFTAVAFLVSGQQWNASPVLVNEQSGIGKKAAFVAPENATYAPQPMNLHVLRSQIGYPVQASNAGIEGEEVFRVYVDGNGSYVRHEVISSTHPLLRIACESALENLRCFPAEVEGSPVSSWTEVRFDFVKQH